MNESSDVYIVRYEKQALAFVVRRDFRPVETIFLTPPDLSQQLGYIVYPAGANIRRHRHVPVSRQVVGTTEVILVKSGKCSADIYAPSGELVSTIELDEGDVIVLVAGGHGFRMGADTILMEVKQGPYTAAEDKEHF